MQALGADSGEVSNDLLAALVSTVVASVLCGDDLGPSSQPPYVEYALWRIKGGQTQLISDATLLYPLSYPLQVYSQCLFDM